MYVIFCLEEDAPRMHQNRKSVIACCHLNACYNILYDKDNSMNICAEERPYISLYHYFLTLKMMIACYRAVTLRHLSLSQTTSLLLIRHEKQKQKAEISKHTYCTRHTNDIKLPALKHYFPRSDIGPMRYHDIQYSYVASILRTFKNKLTHSLQGHKSYIKTIPNSCITECKTCIPNC